MTLTARRRELLERLAQRIAVAGAPRPLVAECDVTRNGDTERAVAETVRQWGKLDVVIANAGFGVVGALKQLSVEDYRRQFETNIFGVLRTIYAALPEIEKAKGNIVIVGSVSGWVSSPGASPYTMSKYGSQKRLIGSPHGIPTKLFVPRFGVTVWFASIAFIDPRKNSSAHSNAKPTPEAQR